MNMEDIQDHFETAQAAVISVPADVIRSWRTGENALHGFPYRAPTPTMTLILGNSWIIWSAAARVYGGSVDEL